MINTHIELTKRLDVDVPVHGSRFSLRTRTHTDTGAIEKICDEVIAANPKSVEDYKAGKGAALNFLKGQVMKLSKGKANPGLAGEILERKLKA